MSRVRRGSPRFAADRPHAGSVDCECVREGFVGQPANTLSSASYVGVAAWLLAGPRRRHRDWWAWWCLGVGVGSMGFHGPGGRIGKLVHDVSVDVLALSLVGSGLLPGDDGRVRLRRGQLEAIALLGAGAVIHQATQTGRRGCRPESVWQGHALWHLVSALGVARWIAATEPVLPEDTLAEVARDGEPLAELPPVALPRSDGEGEALHP